MKRYLFAFAIAAIATGQLDQPALATEQATAERTTAPSALPGHIALGHLDDAAGTDLLQFDHHRLFVTRTDAAETPVMHHWYTANIQSLIVGDFALPGTREHGHDQVCAILSDGSMDCEAPSDDRSELWWWFTQPNPLAPGEQAIIGDFTGDGAADILAYSAQTGKLRLLSRATTGYFAPVQGFALGNLASADLRHKRLYAGEFGQAAGRADLLVVDPGARQLTRFDSASDASGHPTFWWAFTTTANTLRVNEQVTVANVEGGAHDALLLRDPASGRIRALRAEYDRGGLQPVGSNVNLGQLPVTTHSAVLVAVKLASRPSELGDRRDDTLLFDRTTNQMISTEARPDGSAYTYWWSYTRDIPSQSGWGPRRDTPMAVILCKLADVSRTPDKTVIRNRLVAPGTGGLRDYLFEVSYGTIDIANAHVHGWVTSSLKAKDSSARGGKLLTGDFITDCERQAGVDGAALKGHVLVVLNDQNVSFQGINSFGATVEYNAIIAGDIPGIAHETLHAFDLNHANDDTGTDCGDGAPDGEYCDSSDVMGNFGGTQIARGDGSAIGPGLNAGHRSILGVIPASRVVTLDPATAPAKTVVTLAPLEQPEASGALTIRVKQNNAIVTVEYRRPVLLDKNIGITGIQVHSVALGWTILQTRPTPTLAAGATAQVGPFTMHVDSIDDATGRATVTLGH